MGKGGLRGGHKIMAKRQVLALMKSGQSLRTAALAQDVGDWIVHKWRKADPEFNEKVVALQKEKEDRERLARSLLLEMVEHGTGWTIAARRMGLRPSVVYYWRKADPEFDREMKVAIGLCAEGQADRLIHLHEDLPDPKMVTAVGRNLQWYAERRAPEMFSPLVKVQDENPQLLGILQAAVNRLIEQTPARPLPVIEGEAVAVGSAKRLTARRFAEPAPADRHDP